MGDVGTNERGCGVFNGETVALEKCSNTGVGYVCQKQFGKNQESATFYRDKLEIDIEHFELGTNPFVRAQYFKVLNITYC